MYWLKNNGDLLPKDYVDIHRSMKELVDRQQCNGNPFLHFHGNTVNCYIYLNNTNGKYCCISMATIITWTRHDVMLYKLPAVFFLSFFFFLQRSVSLLAQWVFLLTAHLNSDLRQIVQCTDLIREETYCSWCQNKKDKIWKRRWLG
jgi:hypothetical protein